MKVVGELNKVEETYLVVLYRRDIVAEILLKYAVDPFGLTVDVRVEGSGEVELHPK